MYATITSSSASVFSARNSSNMYHRVGVETGVGSASPHQLVTMLLNGALDSIAQARGAIQNKQIEAKCRAITKALAIVDEGLKSCLDLERGGEVAQNLHDLYGYVGTRLIHANLHSDDAALEECARLLTPVRDAWMAIAPSTQADAAAKEFRA